MFSRLLTRANFQTRLVLAIALCGCVAWLTLTFFRSHRRESIGPERAAISLADQPGSSKDSGQSKMEGAAARQYLEETEEGQSLMKAVVTAQYGLKWQQKSPLGESAAGGYLGMSHDQNLNAWFDNEGATIRPTLAQKDRDKNWQLGFKLNGYGYGESLPAAPAIVARNVMGTRIEYERTDCRLTISNCRFGPEGTSALRGRLALETPGNPGVAMSGLLQSAIGNRQSTITEWYENRPEGIEQGFTINAPPERGAGVAANEPLRLRLGIAGDLRARLRDDGQEIVLTDKDGRSALSYGKLSAVDADGKQLAARMEASTDGLEIALVVDDRDAAYPIVIDPIVATLLTSPPLNAGQGAQVGELFGYAVALDGDRAIVGAPRFDFLSGSISDVDSGTVYPLGRNGSTWTLAGGNSFPTASGLCGYSVAISGDNYVFGCPGSNNNTGSVFLIQSGDFFHPHELTTSFRRPGDFYGASVAIAGNNIIVGAPDYDGLANSAPSAGIAYLFRIEVGGNTSSGILAVGNSASDAFGTSVAVDGDTVVVGATQQQRTVRQGLFHQHIRLGDAAARQRQRRRQVRGVRGRERRYGGCRRLGRRPEGQQRRCGLRLRA
jgi:hypothetical protein